MHNLIHRCIDDVAQEDPARLAVTFLDERLDYAGLVSAANRLANALIAAGTRRHDRVGIYLDKCLEVPPFVDVESDHMVACWKEPGKNA